MKRILIFVVLLIIIIVGLQFGSGISKKSNNPVKPEVVTNQQTNSKQSDQPAQIALPQQLSIPKINVEASVEQVGLDQDRKMDVPKNADNVGWYNLGYKPGENGNAVLAGHFDKSDGTPAVFWDIEELSPGDTVSVKDEHGKLYTFSVERIQQYPYNDFPINEVFGESDAPRLNLITCGGNWDAGSRNYSHRIVVYSRLAQ